MEQHVAPPHPVERTVGRVEVGDRRRRPRFEAQVSASDVGEAHQVFHVVVTRTADADIVPVDAEPALEISQHLVGHPPVVDKTHGFAPLAAFHAPGHLLDEALAGIAAEFHLGIARELHGIRLERLVAETGENERQTEPHDIVEKDQTGSPVVRRQHEKPAEILDRQLDQRIIPDHASRTRTPQQTDGQVNARVGQLAELRSPRQDQRISRAVQLVAIDRANIGGLSVGKAAFVQQRDTLFLQLGQNAGERLLELFGIGMDQPVDLAQLPACAGTAAALVLGDAFHRRDAHAKELVQIVAINAQKRQPLQERHVRALRLLQNSMIEIDPAQVAVQGLRCFHGLLPWN